MPSRPGFCRRAGNAVSALLLAAATAALVPSPTTAQARPGDLLRARIDSLFEDSTFSNCFLGVNIITLDNGAVLYERNAGRLFHPASNLKLFTTAAALHLLPPGFVFETTAGTRAAVGDGRLQGDLIVRGSGDPTLRTADLDSLARKIRARGIRIITGDLVGDAGAFDSVYWGHGWMWDDEPDPDEAFITPLTVNGNSVKVLIRSGRRRGSRPTVSVVNPASSVRVHNDAITTSDTSLPPLTVTRQPHVNTIDVSGRILPGGYHETSVSLWRPDLYFLRLFRERLSARGVRVEGKIRLGSGRGIRNIAAVAHSVDDVLREINKESDNLGAENLLKCLAAQATGRPGTSLAGLTLVRGYCAQHGIDTSRITLADGSGVSWYNEVPPSAIVTLLREEYRQGATFSRFRETLPVAGVDGTLANRMRGSPAEGNARAKTGTLTGVSAISGYVSGADGTPMAFSILCNHFRGDLDPLRAVQDSVLVILAEYRRQ